MSVWNACPESLPSQTFDRSERLAWLALAGYPQLAADTLLNGENRGRVHIVVGNAVRRLNLAFIGDRTCREKCYEVLLEVALNLIGMERKRAEFSDEETQAALREVLETLREWETLERAGGNPEAAQAVVQKILSVMKKVLMGQSMVAMMGEEIRKGLDEDNLLESFVSTAIGTIEGNVYYQIVEKGLSKLGNDSATGLRWVRHLGAVQVSSNPVIAARAFEEMPEHWQKFKTLTMTHPEWSEDPERFADEIAMYGTVVSLLPNVLDFRPIALLSDFRDGMVSIQLNPFKAGSMEESRSDAMKIYAILQEVLERYDAHLMGGTVPEGRGRPNVVFKVSGGDPSAISTTETLDAMGLGTNNTVTFTVAQEVRLMLAAIKGLSKALKMGIPATQVYITNMEGRLEDHLRESEASRMLLGFLAGEEDLGYLVNKVAARLGTLETVGKAGSVQEKVSILCARKYLKSLTEDWFVEALDRKDLDSLEQKERDIRMAGILVTRRVFQVGFRQDAISKLVRFVEEEYGISKENASAAVQMVDLLPASKRRAEDTYLVLGGKQITNLTNTEFPDQQVKMYLRSHEEGFKASDYQNSILNQPDAATLKRLLEIEDFRKAYELTPDLVMELGRAKIEVPLENGGITPEDWSSYGPVVKTTHEFKAAYVNFKKSLLDFAKESKL